MRPQALVAALALGAVLTTTASAVLELGRPFPNPNRNGATLSLAVPADAIGTYEADVFDVSGRRVWHARQEVTKAGRYRVEWDGRDGSKQAVAAGV